MISYTAYKNILNLVQEVQEYSTKFEDKVSSYFGKSLCDMCFSQPVVFSDKNDFLRNATVCYTLSDSL